MKICAECNLERPIELFSRDARTSDGRRRYCRPCCRVRSKIRATVVRNMARRGRAA